MVQNETHTRYLRLGLAAMVVGLGAALLGALWAHFTALPLTDDLGRDIYSSIPRGWLWSLLGQLVSVGGVLLLLGGTAVAFLYERRMTWARAALGALLFTALMIILFGIVPNQWLTLTQAQWEWTPQKIALTIPSWLVLGNEVSISFAALKDIISGGYAAGVMGAVAFAMVRWQTRTPRELAAPAAAPEPLSAYGRPLRKVGR